MHITKSYNRDENREKGQLIRRSIWTEKERYIYPDIKYLANLEYKISYFSKNSYNYIQTMYCVNVSYIQVLMEMDGSASLALQLIPIE